MTANEHDLIGVALLVFLVTEVCFTICFVVWMLH